MNIVVVGNGRSDVMRGNLIDSFDYVVRMGSCCIDGYEHYVGTKTSMLRSSWDRFFGKKEDGTHEFVSKIIGFTDFLFLEPYFEPFYETMHFGNVYHLYKIFNKPRFLQKRFISIKNERILHEMFIREHLSQKNIFYYNIKDRVSLFCEYNSMYNDRVLHMPSAGLFTIDYIVKTFTDSDIYITGFDGFKTKYYWRSNDEYFDSHSSIKEQLYLKKLLTKGIIKELP